MNFSIKNSLNKIPIPIQVIFMMYLIGMGIFWFYRSLLFISNAEKTVEHSFSVVLDSMLVGMRFDTTICCYALALPLLLLLINHYVFKANTVFFKVILILTYLFYPVKLLLLLAPMVLAKPAC